MTPPSPKHPSWVHHALFLATSLTVFATFKFMWLPSTEPQLNAQAMLCMACLMAILLAHEFGHYFAAKFHGVETSLPYFLPLPLLGFGTLGAVIRMRGKIPHKNALVDIGASGPLAGMLVAFVVLCIGIAQSSPAPSVVVPSELFGHFSIVSIVKGFFVEAPPELGFQLFGDNGLTWILQRIFHGVLEPGQELTASPLFLVGWFGCVLTMLNLLPIGQFDGGHVMHALLGQRAESVGKAVAIGTLMLAVVGSVSWLLWTFLAVQVVKFSHPPVVDESIPLDAKRKVICLLCVLVFVLTFIPIPIDAM
jgi:membrane-associated protease RseP (regulator of RpoE activity)